MTETLPIKPLDLGGLKCPLPALRAYKALRRLQPGAFLVVECTDPMSRIDISHLVQQTGCKLELSTQTDTIFISHIRRA
ncbi:MAG: sulfurtransferase TusA family protein [Beijerinckiaceae bacterium]